MKISEIILVEAKKKVKKDKSSAKHKAHNQSMKAKFEADISHAIPGMRIHPSLDNSNPYNAYRYGVMLAGSPDNNHIDKSGPVAQKLTTVAYTEAEAEMISRADSRMGVNSVAVTTRKSDEQDGTNTKSPIIARGPIKGRR